MRGNEHPKAHQRYRIVVMRGEDVMHKLSVSSSENIFKVMDIARRELNHTLAATHVAVRGLTGKEIELTRNNGWLGAQLKAFKLLG